MKYYNLRLDFIMVLSSDLCFYNFVIQFWLLPAALSVMIHSTLLPQSLESEVSVWLLGGMIRVLVAPLCKVRMMYFIFVALLGAFFLAVKTILFLASSLGCVEHGLWK